MKNTCPLSDVLQKFIEVLFGQHEFNEIKLFLFFLLWGFFFNLDFNLLVFVSFGIWKVLINVELRNDVGDHWLILMRLGLNLLTILMFFFKRGLRLPSLTAIFTVIWNNVWNNSWQVDRAAFVIWNFLRGILLVIRPAKLVVLDEGIVFFLSYSFVLACHWQRMRLIELFVLFFNLVHFLIN